MPRIGDSTSRQSLGRGAAVPSWLSLCLVLGVVLGLNSCTSRQPEAPRLNVILITVDTLRADHVGCYGNSAVETPAMDGLARDGVMFTHAVAQVPLTAPSHAAILTGTYPVWNGLRDWSDHRLRPGVPTLAEIFKSHGYTTAAFVSAFVLDSMWGLNRGFDVYDDWFKAEEYRKAQHQGVERRADETVDHSIAWLKSLNARPFFLWVHLYDPHSPYDPPEPFRTRFRGRLYDGEVAFTDHEIGRFFDFLKSQNLYGPSLIVLTSDHGEGLGEHQEEDHGFFIYNATVHVPLIVKLPAGHASGRRLVPDVVNSVDIAPTLVRLSGFPTTDARTFQGQSLLSLMESGSASASRNGFSESLYPRNFLGAHTLFGVQTGQYHYIEAPREELYDLASDPAELQDIRARYRRPTEAAGQSPGLTPEAIEKLRSLGYVSLSSAKPFSEDDPSAPDPKDTIRAYNRIMKATALAESGRLREANRVLAALAAEHPKVYLLPFLEGENLLAMGQARKAMAFYRRSLQLNPGYDQAAIGLGRAAYRAEENSEAAKAYQLALELNPHDFLARLALARVDWRLKQLDSAAAEQQTVLRSHPQFAQAHADYGVTLVHMHRFGEAIPSLEKGIGLGYRDAMAYNFLGNAYAATGRTDDAVGAYQQATQIDATYPTAFVNLALLYAQKGERAKAREYFQKACRLNEELCRALAPRFR